MSALLDFYGEIYNAKIFGLLPKHQKKYSRLRREKFLIKLHHYSLHTHNGKQISVYIFNSVDF